MEGPCGLREHWLEELGCPLEASDGVDGWGMALAWAWRIHTASLASPTPPPTQPAVPLGEIPNIPINNQNPHKLLVKHIPNSLSPESYDTAFFHVLFQCLRHSDRTDYDFRKILRPGTILGLRDTDCVGLLLAQPSTQLSTAIDRNGKSRISDGGDPHVGGKLGQLHDEVGFEAESESKARGSWILGSYRGVSSLQLENSDETRQTSTILERAPMPSGISDPA